MRIHLEVNSLIIVESRNDQFFIEKLKDFLNFDKNNDVQPICNDSTDFECLSGGIDKIKLKLSVIKYDQYDKIGIVLDADSDGIEKKLELINEKLKHKTVDIDIKFSKINELIYSKNKDVHFAVYITNVDGKGELETLLRKVKNKDSNHADCLEAWRNCLQSKKVEITDKDFNKFWVNNYLRFDTCNKNERRQAGIKCMGELAIKKDIWDLNHPLLTDLKEFLTIICS